MAKITFEHSLDKMILELNSADSFEHINEVLFEHCDETMQVNHPDIVVEYPVYLKEVYDIHSDGKGKRFIHIGYVAFLYDREETVYTVQHFTLDRKELHNEWHPFYFYKGEYGFKK
ncbi:hypothetical protein WFK94_20450 [Yersinia enterocolitica]